MALRWWHKLTNRLSKDSARQQRRPGPGQAGRRTPCLERLEDRMLLATPGSLDTTFGTGGKVLTDFPGLPRTEGYPVAVQPDGKIVVAVRAGAPDGTGDFALARYLSDGRLDPSFDGDGKLTTDFGGDEEVAALVLQPDGKIIVAGTTGPFSASDFALARYLSDGRLDTSFDGDGKLTTDFGASESAFAIALQPDGKIIAAGRDKIARYLPDGRLDPTFDDDGKVPINRPSVSTLALQPDGKIVVAGSGLAAPAASFGLARHLPDGRLDTTFGRDGIATTILGRMGGTIKALALQPDGKIVAAGWAYAGTFPSLVLARYDADGGPDSSFGNGGRLATDLYGSYLGPNGIIVQPDGKLLVAAVRNGNFALARYLADGRPDVTFDGDGELSTDFGGEDVARGLALQPDGKVVAVGDGGGKFALARYYAFQGGRFQLSAGTYTASEAAGTVIVTVTCADGSEGTATVRYATADGTAKAGTDYTATSGTLTFAAGETSKTFTVAVTDDRQVKLLRDFKVRLSAPGGAALSDPAEATVTILDNVLPEVPNSPAPAVLAQAALGFAKSREQYQNLVTRAYERFLKRAPDDLGLRGWTDLMQAGKVTEERLEAGFLASPEYITRNGGRGRGWVVGMYKDLLGRTPAEVEVQAWLDVLQAGRAEYDVAYGFAASPEREGQRVQANYRTYLDRAASAQEVAAYVDLFVRGLATNQDITAKFVGSPEYYANPTKGRGNRAIWIVNAYEQVLFRSPGRGEVEAWLNLLR